MHVERIREVLRTQPFRPFTLRLVDGRKFAVPHPDFVAVARRVVLAVDQETDGISWVEPALIISLDFADGAPGPAAEPSDRDNP